MSSFAWVVVVVAFIAILATGTLSFVAIRLVLEIGRPRSPRGKHRG